MIAEGDQRLELFIHTCDSIFYIVISSGIYLQNELQYMNCTECLFSHSSLSMEGFLDGSLWMTCRGLDYVSHPLNL